MVACRRTYLILFMLFRQARHDSIWVGIYLRISIEISSLRIGWEAVSQWGFFEGRHQKSAYPGYPFCNSQSSLYDISYLKSPFSEISWVIYCHDVAKKAAGPYSCLWHVLWIPAVEPASKTNSGRTILNRTVMMNNLGEKTIIKNEKAGIRF